MAETRSIDVTAEVHYKIIGGVPKIEGVYVCGENIIEEVNARWFDKMRKEILSQIEPPLENEGTDWEGYARQGNESNLE